MARTKRAGSVKVAAKPKASKQTIEVQAVHEKATEMMQSLLDRVDEDMKTDLEALASLNSSVVFRIPDFLMDKTIREILSGEVSSQTTICTSTFSSNVSHLASSTKINSSIKGRPPGSRTNSATRIASSFLKTGSNTRSSSRKRSLSATYDGSSESSHVITSTTSNNGRRSRTRTVTKTATKPVARSLSRTGQTTASMYKTPAGRGPNSEVGMITPKCKPNTPQIILRRPKQGEIAISYGGSPLLTGSSTREDVANINIPLPNGDLLSLLPQTGLRPSLIPVVDDSTRRELEILRDNLIKVCSSIK